MKHQYIDYELSKTAEESISRGLKYLKYGLITGVIIILFILLAIFLKRYY